MKLRIRARRLAAKLRLAVQGPPLSRMIRLLRRGETGGREYVDLCLQLGLATRAAAALREASDLEAYPSLPIRLAALAGDRSRVIALAQALVERLPDRLLTRRELEAAASCVMPISPPTALSLIGAGGVLPFADPALRLRLGDVDGCKRGLDRLGDSLGPQRWLLQANLEAEPHRQLGCFNRFLGENGLAVVRLRDPVRPLSVGNLEGMGPPSTPSRLDAKLSVVMTCHDCASYVDAAIRSVLSQTHRNLELIAVDDGSTDGTWSRLQAAAATDARVRPLRLQDNVGTYAAKNVGLTLVGGEYVAFQDADDFALSERFGRCLDVLAHRPWLDAVSCEYIRLREDGRFWSSLIWPMQRRTPNSIVLRRRVLKRIGFFDENRFGADSEFVARLQVEFGPRALHRLPLPLIVAALRENSLMTAASTGLDETGRSQVRARYQEQWTEDLLQQAVASESLYRQAGQRTLIATADAKGQ